MTRKRAIQEALGRLGMQAGNREVVALLAEWGIGVTEGLVRQVKVEILKGMARAERQKAPAPDRCRRPPVRLPPKIPPSR